MFQLQHWNGTGLFIYTEKSLPKCTWGWSFHNYNIFYLHWKIIVLPWVFKAFRKSKLDFNLLFSLFQNPSLSPFKLLGDSTSRQVFLSNLYMQKWRPRLVINAVYCLNTLTGHLMPKISYCIKRPLLSSQGLLFHFPNCPPDCWLSSAPGRNAFSCFLS